MKIIDVITSSLLLIFPKIFIKFSGKFTTIGTIDCLKNRLWNYLLCAKIAHVRNVLLWTTTTGWLKKV